MPLTWKLRLYDHDGALLAELDTWKDFTLTRSVNAPDTYGLQLQGDDPLCQLFELDGILEPWWRWPERGIAWQRETALWTIGTKRWTSADRARHFISSGKGLDDLLGRVIIDSYTGNGATDKSGLGEAVIKAFVNEQLGPAAGARARTGVTIEGPGGLGVAWAGDRTNKPLLGVVQEIAETSDLQFGLIRTAAYAFEFRVWAPTDRTATVRFTEAMGNMVEPMVTTRHDQIKNWIKVGGQGEGIARVYRYVTDPASIALSPQNQREEFVQATDQTTNAKLDEKGRARLAQNAKLTEFSFKPAQIAGCTYGLHYFLGDLVTAIYDSVTYTVRVNSVKIQVNENGTSVNAEMIDAT